MRGCGLVVRQWLRIRHAAFGQSCDSLRRPKTRRWSDNWLLMQLPVCGVLVGYLSTRQKARFGAALAYLHPDVRQMPMADGPQKSGNATGATRLRSAHGFT